MRYTIYIIQSSTYVVYTKPSFNILYQKMLDILGSYSKFCILCYVQNKVYLETQFAEKVYRLPMIIGYARCSTADQSRTSLATSVTVYDD